MRSSFSLESSRHFWSGKGLIPRPVVSVARYCSPKPVVSVGVTAVQDQLSVWVLLQLSEWGIIAVHAVISVGCYCSPAVVVVGVTAVQGQLSVWVLLHLSVWVLQSKASGHCGCYCTPRPVVSVDVTAVVSVGCYVSPYLRPMVGDTDSTPDSE